MEYNPRYPQPFTLTQAIALDPAVAWDEIARLRNSLSHLRRSQDELQEYLRELASEDGDFEASEAVKENEVTIASQDERIFMLKLALTHHGHSVTTEPPSESTGAGRSRNTVGASSNGLDDFPPVGHASESTPRRETSDTAEQENGVYL